MRLNEYILIIEGREENHLVIIDRGIILIEVIHIIILIISIIIKINIDFLEFEIFYVGIDQYDLLCRLVIKSFIKIMLGKSNKSYPHFDW
jgi:hypothetical protein